MDVRKINMGLDMYAYVAAEPASHWTDNHNSREIAYWRKHPNLHGWMEKLWRSKNTDPAQDPGFNGVELELTWQDLEQLEHDIKSGELPDTVGFFFGTDADDYYREQDLDFVRKARAELFMGLRVFYNSSW